MAEQASNKVVLGKRPETFKPIPVAFELPDGAQASITATYRYRTRTEFGDLIDALFTEAGETPPVEGGIEVGLLRKVMEKTRDKNADYLLKILAAWDLESPVGIDVLRQLADELPAASLALMEAYRAACVEGRLGN